jgi:hypothetical protein
MLSFDFSQSFSDWTQVLGPITLAPAGRALRLNIQLAPNQQLTPGFVLESLPFALSIRSMGATNDQILKWNGTAWAPASDDTGLSYFRTCCWRS